jgi:hypothetical protein
MASSSTPGAALVPARDPESETTSTAGSRRRAIEPYAGIWVRADIVQNYDVKMIATTSRRERVHYRPNVGAPFDVMEEHERPAPPRSVDGTLEGLEGSSFKGKVIRLLPTRGSLYAGALLTELDNRERWILPGMRLALAVHTDEEPVVLIGIAELPQAVANRETISSSTPP